MRPLPNLKGLFLCRGNSCRSQMAGGRARHLKADATEPHSAQEAFDCCRRVRDDVRGLIETLPQSLAMKG